MQIEDEIPNFKNQKFFTPSTSFLPPSTTACQLKSVECHFFVDSASAAKKSQIRDRRTNRFTGVLGRTWSFHFKKSCHMPSLMTVSGESIFEAKNVEIVDFEVFCINWSWTLTLLCMYYFEQVSLLTAFSNSF